MAHRPDPRDLRRLAFAALLSGVALTAGCHADALVTTPEAPGSGPAGVAAIAVVSGNDQTDTAGATLDDPYVVRITDSTGNELAGVTVTWTVTGGGGSVTPTSTTDDDGYARATRVLGPTAGLQTATAVAAGMPDPPARFTATARSGTPTRLAFTVEPSDASAGAPITPAIEVSALDGFGNTASGFAGAVTLVLGTNPGGAALEGTTTRSAVAGVATFAGLSVTRAGSGYQLRSDAGGLTGAASTAFDVTSASATRIQGVSGSNQTATVGTTLGQPYVVRVTDALGNPVAGVAVSWTVTQGGGAIAPDGGTTDASGEARATYTLGTTAGPQTVLASATGLTGSPVTFPATATPGPAARLVFTQQPSGTSANAVITPAVRVTAQDQYGNIATGVSGTVTLSIAPLTGTPGATLSGTRSRSWTSGTAVFDDLRIDLVGLGYRLRAAAGSFSEDSGAFDVLL